jgi:dTDP-4-dehydrorhamnose reductase
VLIGSSGQVGSEITRLWPTRPELCSVELIGLTHAGIEITDRDSVEATLENTGADIVINTAGFLRVDECESAPDKACAVNAFGVKYLAEGAAKRGCFVVQFSTDYVFDGRKATPYTESDATTPINAYGVSKLMGEHFLRYCLPDRHLIVRTSGVFGVAGSRNKGGNFVETMLRLAGSGQPLSVVNDQVFSPTHAPDLARATLELISKGARGLVHITNAGSTTWHDFAKAAFIATGRQPELRAVTSSEYAAAANRPRYSVLDNSLAIELGATPLRPWNEALDEYLGLRRD